MTLSSYELIEINAVVIIGLTIFLSFQSITSVFIENDMLTFFQQMRDDYLKYEKLGEILVNCHLARNENNTDSFEYSLLENVEYEGKGNEYYKNLTNSVIKKLQNSCVDYGIERISLKEKILASQNYGLKIGYLEDNYDNRKRTDDGTIIVTSEWFKEVASGPIQVIIINLVMVMPFAVSAIIELVYSTSKESSNPASKIGVSISIAGFVVLVIGFLIIGYFFIKANLLFS